MSVKRLSEERQRLLKERKEFLKSCLPHKYGFDLFPFQKELVECTKEFQFLTAANQVGKTSCLMLKLIHFATDVENWHKYWVDKPKMFIYFLPSQGMHDDFVRTKWLDFLPSGPMKTTSPQYGWKWVKNGKYHIGIKFNSGVYLKFASYGMKVDNLQGISSQLTVVDEEPDYYLVNEIQTRGSAVLVSDLNKKNAYGGFKVFGFTATKSQKEFAQIFEKGEREAFPLSMGNVWKKQVSLYDCQKHVSGKPSQWTDKKIESAKKAMRSEAEVNRRIYGLFQATDGLVYESFEYEKNTTDKLPQVGQDWEIYAGIDWGSGGVNAHSSSIVFVHVSPCYTKGRVIETWSGEGSETTCEDVVNQYIEMKDGRSVTIASYDYGAKDLETHASRKGIYLEKAIKDKKRGRATLNAIFKRGILKIYADHPDNAVLISEIQTLVDGYNKKSKKSVDDMADALRYACAPIPWNFDTTSEVTVSRGVDNGQNRGFKRRRSEEAGFHGESEEDYMSEEEHEWAGLFDF